jgi:hypothetical protein
LLLPDLYLIQFRHFFVSLNSIQALGPTQLNGAGAIFTVVLLILLAIVTLYATLRRQYEEYLNAQQTNVALNDDQPLLPSTSKPPKKKESLLYTFDMVTNWNELIKSPGINAGLKSLDGMKVLSMVWLSPRIISQTGNACLILVQARVCVSFTVFFHSTLFVTLALPCS